MRIIHQSIECRCYRDASPFAAAGDRPRHGRCPGLQRLNSIESLRVQEALRMCRPSACRHLPQKKMASAVVACRDRPPSWFGALEYVSMQARARIQPIVEIFSPPLALAPVPPPFMRAINRRQSNGRSPRVLGPSREILRHGQLGLLGPLGKSVTTPVPTFFAHPWMLGRGCPEPGARPP